MEEVEKKKKKKKKKKEEENKEQHINRDDTLPRSVGHVASAGHLP